jgi:hypothetical protein
MVTKRLGILKRRSFYFLLIIIAFSLQQNLSGQIVRERRPDHFRSVNDTLYDNLLDSLHQVIDDDLDGILDSTHIEAEFYTFSKSLYFGRQFGYPGFLFTPKFTYYNKSGLGFSIVNYIWPQGSPKFAVTDIVLSYSHTVNTWWDFGLDYIYWLIYKDFPSSLDWNNQIEFSNYFMIGNWLSANTSMVFMFGSDKGFILQESFAHSFFLYPGSLFHRITIEPETGFYMGNENINRLFNPKQQNTFNSSHIFDMLDYYAVLKVSAQYNRFIMGGSFQTDFPQKASNDINFSTKPILSFSLNVTWLFKL